jgi:hypothetical protein
MNKKNRILALMAVLGAVSFRPSSFAQELPRPMLVIESSANNFARFSKSAAPALTNQKSSVGSLLFSGSFVYPIVADQGRTIVFLQTGFRQRTFGYRDWPDGISRELKNIHEVTVSTTGRRQLSEQWALSINLTAQAASDFEKNKLTPEDMKYTAMIIAERQMNDKLGLGLGAAFTTSFGSLLPLPIITLRWDDGKSWSANAFLPSSFDIWYRTSDEFRFGLSAAAEGQQYHTAILPNASKRDNLQLQYISADVGPAVRWSPLSSLALTLRSGVTFQSLLFFDGTDEIKDTNYNLDPCGFIQIGTAMSF